MRRRTAVTTLTLAVFALHVDVASAEPKGPECIDSHAKAQVLRRDGKLRAARNQLVVCAASDCPKLVSGDCTTWLNEIATEMPSVVVDARQGGREVAAVRVRVDGEVVAQSLEGKPVEVDPGQHVFRYELADGTFVESKELIQEREKARLLHVDFSPPAPVPAPTPASASSADTTVPHSHRISPVTWIVGGAGVVALGLWGYFGLTGLSQESHLSSSCSPNCSPGNLSSLKTQYAIADVSLGVGIVALGIATVIGITSASSAPAPTSRGAWLTFTPVASGATGGVGGRF